MVRTERADGYEAILRAIPYSLNVFFPNYTHFKVAVINMDHNGQFVAAIKRVQQCANESDDLKMFDLAVPMLCWAHISRTALIQNKAKFKLQNRLEDFKDHLYVLHMARSQEQFTLLSSRMIDLWESLGESALASWFRQEYMSPDYCRWSITCSGIPGLTPNNNLVETFHRDHKRDLGINRPRYFYHINLIN